VIATTLTHPVESLGSAHYLIEDLTGIEVTSLPGDEGLALRFMPLAG
jgi:hypothetical protein